MNASYRLRKMLLYLGLTVTTLHVLDFLTTYIGVICLGFDECVTITKQLINAYGVLGLAICKAIPSLVGIMAVVIPIALEKRVDNSLKITIYCYVIGLLIISNVYMVSVVANNFYWLTLWMLKAI